MPGMRESSTGSDMRDVPRIDLRDLRLLRQELLATLADMDIAHRSEVAIVSESDAEAWLKQTVIRRLEECHQERCNPFLRQLAAFERRIRTLAA